MFAQSNDLFFAPEPNGIPLFDAAGRARSGDSPDSIVLWDAGTEMNEQPGAGPNQAPRQAAPGPRTVTSVRSMMALLIRTRATFWHCRSRLSGQVRPRAAADHAMESARRGSAIAG